MTNLIISEIEKYSEIYEFNFLFWGEGKNNVFIYKGNVELTSFGDCRSIEGCLIEALSYIYRINRVPMIKRVI